MLTGRLPFEHGVRDNLGFTLGAGKPTLAARFDAAGYKTGGFVSAYVLRPETGIGQGFDVYNADVAGRRPRIARSRRCSGPAQQTLAAAEAGSAR